MSTRKSIPILLVGLGSWLPACLGPGETEQGTAEEFGRMFAESGAEPIFGTDEPGLADEIERDAYALADPQEVAAEEPADVPDFEAPIIEQNPYLRFGERILVREFEDGTTFVTKPYPMPPGRGAKIVELLDALEPFAYRERPAADPETGQIPHDAEVVTYQILENWDTEYFGSLSAELKAATATDAVPISDLVVVTAVPDKLADFESFIDTFAAGVPQIELEAKIIEIVETDTLDIGITPIDDTTDIFTFGAANFVKGFNFNLPNVANQTESLLTLGGIHDGVAFNAVIEAVKTWENVTIESRPKSVVRAGGVAQLLSTTEIPFFNVNSITPNGGFNATTAYKEVGTKLYIAPRVVGSKTLALEISLEGSQVVGFQRVITQQSDDASTVSGIDVPVIAYRTAKTVVYLEPGQTLVMGGLTRESTRETENKVPILGDIPYLGILFRSTFQSVEREHVIFAISPRIVQQSEFLSEL